MTHSENNPTDLQLWDKLYQSIDQFFALKPYKILHEQDIFAVRMPDGKRDYFISIMGRNDEVYALSAYEGAEALYQYWVLYEYEEYLPPESILLIPHMMVTLDDREEITKEQYSIIKQLGRKYRGRQSWPNVRRIVPGYVPIMPGNKRLHDLIHILDQSTEVVKRASESKHFIHNETHHDDEYLYREIKKDKGKQAWGDNYRRVPEPELKQTITYQEGQLNAYKNLPEQKRTVQTDLKMLPFPVKEKGEHPQYPFVLVLVDSESSMILDFEMLNPNPDFQTMIGQLPGIILGKFIDQGWRPEEILFKSPQLESIMGFMEQEANQSVGHMVDLPELDQAVNAIVQGMGNS